LSNLIDSKEKSLAPDALKAVVDSQITSSDTDQPTQWIGAMMQAGMQEAVESILPITETAGLELVGLERAQEGRRLTLWVYLDHPNGITLDQCANVTAEISAALDVIDPIANAYDLRVSSPGIERPLLCNHHFEKYQGSQIQLRLMTPIRGRRKFKGHIIDVQNHLRIACADGEHEIPLSFIHRAQLFYDDTEYRALLKAREIKES
jgi:ribosome maturation factor RimP